MPPEQSHPSNASSARKGSAEQSQHPPITGGVRGLLGLPMRERAAAPTTSLIAPPHGHHSGHPPLPTSEENDESFQEVTREAGLGEERDGALAQPHSDFPRALPRAGASLSNTRAENPADTPPASAEILTGRREHTSLVIPGVSTHRTQFAALSYTSDVAKVTQRDGVQEARANQAASLHIPALPSSTRETGQFYRALLSNIEQVEQIERLVNESPQKRPSAEAQQLVMAARPPSLVEQIGAAREERGDSDTARQLTQLHHTVNELTATVAAQAARLRDQSQAQAREHQTLSQRLSVVQHGNASSTTPHAFWERSRLGRLHLRTGR